MGGVPPTFDVQDVIRRVTRGDESGFARLLAPTSSLELTPDAPVGSFTRELPQRPKLAQGGGIYLLAWSIQLGGGGYQILGTRVRASDGMVLDPGGILLGTSLFQPPNPVVASDGTDFLVAWGSQGPQPGAFILARRVQGATGALLESEPLRISPSTSWSSTPAIAFDGSQYLVVWTNTLSAEAALIEGARVRASDGVVLDPTGLLLSSAPGLRRNPEVAFSEGHFLVVWEDERMGNSDIYGTRVRASDGAVLESWGRALVDNPGKQLMPVVAAIDGTFLVVWMELNSYSIVYIIGKRVLASSGEVIDQTLWFASGDRFDIAPPALVSDGTHFLLMWSSSTSLPSGKDLLGIRIPTTGQVSAPPVQVVAFGTDGEESPAMAFDGKNLLAVWRETRNAGQLFGARLDPSSWMTLDPAPLLLSSLFNQQLMPTVAGGTTTSLVVWMDSRDRSGAFDIYGVRVRNSDGVILDPTAIPIVQAAGAQVQPAVAFDGSNYLVVWNDRGTRDSPSGAIRGARVRAADGRVLDPSGILLSNMALNDAEPAVAFGMGTYLVTWKDWQANAGIRGARVRAVDGRVLDPTGINVTGMSGFPSAPSVAFGLDSFLVVWEDSRKGTPDIYAARVRADGKVLDTAGIPLSTAPGTQAYPAVAFDGSNFLAVWLDMRPGASDIHGARVRAWDGVVLDGAGLALCTEPGDQGAPQLVFNGSVYLMTWMDIRQGVWRFNGMRMTTQGTSLDGSGLLIADITQGKSSTMTAPVSAAGPGRFLVAYDRLDAESRQPRVRLRRVFEPLGNGAACERGTDCASGICTEGVCL